MKVLHIFHLAKCVHLYRNKNRSLKTSDIEIQSNSLHRKSVLA